MKDVRKVAEDTYKIELNDGKLVYIKEINGKLNITTVSNAITVTRTTHGQNIRLG
jgi:hypothetical protein